MGLVVDELLQISKMIGALVEPETRSNALALQEPPKIPR